MKKNFLVIGLGEFGKSVAKTLYKNKATVMAIDSNEELAKELADIIHYTVAIAAINDIDLTKTIFEKDKKAAIKYQHERDLEGYLEAEGQN